ncbi:MAG: hypothetical protein JO306_16175 [Gemmatimonadetes bacterium]|nr:hypothetical protein [Gemmatimonadota bacterium]
MTEAPALPDFTILRMIAEAASGVRGVAPDKAMKTVWLIYDPDPDPKGPYAAYKNRVRVAKVRPDGTYSKRATVIKAASCSTNPSPLRPTRASICRGETCVDLLNLGETPDGTRVAADAVFWTESAVEKFVVPYYASVHGPGAAQAVANVLGALHGPPPGGNGGMDQLRETSFALIHLPTSEYIEGPPALKGTDAQADEFYLAMLPATEGAPVVLMSLDAWVRRNYPRMEG